MSELPPLPRRRPSFRRGQEHVAVRPLRLGVDVLLQPGDDVPDWVRPWRLRNLYHQNRIAVKGSDWARAMLARAESRSAEAVADRKARAAEDAKSADRKGVLKRALGKMLGDKESTDE